jgi:hypothetical protein
MYMVRPLIFSSHLDEAKLQAAVKTLVNACPFLAGRLQKDPSTGEFAILCSNSATTTRQVACSACPACSNHWKQALHVALAINYSARFLSDGFVFPAAPHITRLLCPDACGKLQE